MCLFCSKTQQHLLKQDAEGVFPVQRGELYSVHVLPELATAQLEGVHRYLHKQSFWVS